MRLRALRKCLLHVITKPENAARSKSNSTDEEVVEIRENATAPIIICFRSRRAQSPGVQSIIAGNENAVETFDGKQAGEHLAK